VTSTGHDQPGVRKQVNHPARQSLELLITLSRQDVDRHRQLYESVPQRGHLAGAEPSQHRGQGIGHVAALVRAREGCDLRRIRVEQRLG
jgi:hypothetical protein